MSGIAGIIRLDRQSLAIPEIRVMLDAMAHRGPDGSNVWIRGSAGFGHNSFWTTPEAKHERQPLWLSDEQIAVTCDARIDNRDELIGLLSIYRPAIEVPDSEIVLRAYAKWGEQCPEHLVGDFSFVVWDERSRRLFCARDRLGVKPFVYCYLPGRMFAFASEIRALTVVPDVPKRLNEWIVAELFEPTLEGFEKSATFYRDIKRLEPSCSLTVSERTLCLRPYWSLDPSRETRLPKDEDYVEAYREIFQEAVRCRIRGLDHVGVLLSGGIDSNSVLATAERVSRSEGTEIHSLSAVAEQGCPERPFMEATLQKVPVTSHFMHSGQVIEFISDFDSAVEYADEPVEPTRHYSNRILWRVAQQNGIRVTLSGVDGDMATTPGYGISYLLARGRWLKAVRECAVIGKRNNLTTWSFLKSDGLRPLAPDLVVRAWDRWKGRVNHGGIKFLDKQYSARIRLPERLKGIAAQFPATEHPRVCQARFATCGILAFAYEQQDISANRISIEPRHPFSDHRLIEFCLAVPREQSVRDGCVKALLRRGADPRIPGEVRWRTARPTVGPWFMRQVSLLRRALLEDLKANADCLGRYLNANALKSAYGHYVTTQDDEDLYLLLSAVYLLAWQRRSCLTE